MISRKKTIVLYIISFIFPICGFSIETSKGIEVYFGGDNHPLLLQTHTKKDKRWLTVRILKKSEKDTDSKTYFRVISGADSSRLVVGSTGIGLEIPYEKKEKKAFHKTLELKLKNESSWGFIALLDEISSHAFALK